MNNEKEYFELDTSKEIEYMSRDEFVFTFWVWHTNFKLNSYGNQKNRGINN